MVQGFSPTPWILGEPAESPVLNTLLCSPHWGGSSTGVPLPYYCHHTSVKLFPCLNPTDLHLPQHHIWFTEAKWLNRLGDTNPHHYGKVGGAAVWDTSSRVCICSRRLKMAPGEKEWVPAGVFQEGVRAPETGTVAHYVVFLWSLI